MVPEASVDPSIASEPHRPPATPPSTGVGGKEGTGPGDQAADVAASPRQAPGLPRESGTPKERTRRSSTQGSTIAAAADLDAPESHKLPRAADAAGRGAGRATPVAASSPPPPAREEATARAEADRGDAAGEALLHAAGGGDGAYLPVAEPSASSVEPREGRRGEDASPASSGEAIVRVPDEAPLAPDTVLEARRATLTAAGADGEARLGVEAVALEPTAPSRPPLAQHHVPPEFLSTGYRPSDGGPARDADEPGPSPLLVFVNGRSGGQVGARLLGSFRRVLGAEQVIDLSERRPDEVIRTLYANLAAAREAGDRRAPRLAGSLRLLAAGGDGTVTWILKALLDEGPSPVPPVAILPLGTGNDLSQSLGWGEGFSSKWISPSGLPKTLARVERAAPVTVDAWNLTIEHPSAVSGAALPPALRLSPGGTPSAASGTFWNYFSLGLDARATHSFHALRESTPRAASSRVVNKAWYAFFSCSSGWFCGAPSIAPGLQLHVRGGIEGPPDAWREVRVPRATRALLVLNLQSYGGGRDVWGLADDRGIVPDGPVDTAAGPDRAERDGDGRAPPQRGDGRAPPQRPARQRTFRAPSADDGLLEIVSFGTGWHAALAMGEVASRAHATRIAQCSELRLELSGLDGSRGVRGDGDERTYAQIDGEPWVQQLPEAGQGSVPLRITVRRAGKSAVLLNDRAVQGGGRARRVAARTAGTLAHGATAAARAGA